MGFDKSRIYFPLSEQHQMKCVFFYGNYEEDKAKEMLAHAWNKLASAKSSLRLVAEKWHNNKGDGNCMKRCVKFCGNWESWGGGGGGGGDDAPVRAHATVTNLQLRSRRSMRHSEQDGAFFSLSQKHWYFRHEILFPEGKCRNLNGSIIQPELHSFTQYIQVTFFIFV